jgi:hypothetical protein
MTREDPAGRRERDWHENCLADGSGKEPTMDATTTLPFRNLDVLRDGWVKTRANLGPLMLLGGVGAFLALLHQALSHPGHDGLGNLLSLMVQVLQSLLAMVFMRSALALASDRPLQLTPPRAELFSDFFGYLLTSIVYGLIVGVGLVLLVVPGVIWAIRFGFATFLAIDAKLDPIAALRESSRITQGVKGPLLRFALLALCVNVLGAAAFGIGLLVTVPTTLIAAAEVLRRLQERAREIDQQIAAEEPASGIPERFFKEPVS